MKCPHCGSGTLVSGGRCGSCGQPVAGERATLAAVTLTEPADAQETRLEPGPVVPLSGSGLRHSNTGAAASRAGGVLTPGETFGSRYHVIRLLGAGGMGAVYQAWDDALGVPVALKVIRPDALVDPETAHNIERRFKRELILARQVTHKNVVRIHDLGEINGIKYITMPYIQGSDLATVLKREGTLSVPRAIAVARQVAAGLLAAHEVGIVHRDLKPANIMIDADDQALIMDFGIARSTAADGGTALGAVVGTLEYMAPEQAMGQPVDQRADIYAFGLILYDMVVGRREASRAESAVAELMNRMNQAPPSPRTIDPTVPPALDAVISRCVEPDPARRYQTTAELLGALEALSGEGTAVRGLDTASRERVGAPARTLSARTLLSVTAAVLLVGVGALALNRWPWAGGSETSASPGAATALAILPFGNATGDASLDALGLAIADMVRSELGRSATLRLVPTDRVHQILRDLRVTGSTADTSMLNRIADFTNADTLIAGEYFKVGSRIRLAAAIHIPHRDTPVSLSAEAADQGELLGAVSTLTRSIRDNLSLPSTVVKELQSRALKPSSQSVQALQAYSQGMSLLREGSNQDALKKFEAAMAADANFALAFARLGQTYHALGYSKEAEKYSSQAVSLSAGLPAEERHIVLGTHARISGDLEKAIEAYRNLAAAVPGDTQVHFELAKLFQERGRFDDARTRLKVVLDKDPKYVDALLELARVEIRSRQPQAALDALTRALPLAVDLGNDEMRAAILQAYGVAYWRLNKPDEAVRYYRDAMAIRQRLKQSRGIADAHQGIAQVEADRGEWQSALENYREALRIRREIGDKRGTGNLLIDMANVHADRLEYEDALTLFREALQIQREVGNQAYEALALSNMGTIYLARGAYDDAQTYFERALGLREKMNVPGAIATTLHNLAETSVKLGAYDTALDRYVKALGIRRGASDKQGTAIVLSGQATLFLLQGRYGAALDTVTEAAGLMREAGGRSTWYPKILNVHGMALSSVGRYDEADAVYTEALKHAREQKSVEVVARVLTMQGDNLFFRGDMTGARRLYDEAVTTASGARDAREPEHLARVRLARLELHQKQPRRAAPHLRALTRDTDAYIAVQTALLGAEAEIQQGQGRRAIEQLQTVVGRADRLGARALAAHGHYLLMTALTTVGQKADAARHRERVRELLEQIRKDARSDGVLTRTDLKVMAAATSN